jgi:alkyl hydroperoxide reductase subunit AhpF
MDSDFKLESAREHDSPKTEPLPLEPGDYYMDGPNLVFTEQYHLKRGYCCGSGCRHCPY